MIENNEGEEVRGEKVFIFKNLFSFVPAGS
jgi:hypothetical protein